MAHATKVNLSEWQRGELFKFYINEMRIVMSLTVDINITRLLAYVKKNCLRFYPVMLWTVAKVLNAHDEFKYGWDSDGDLIQWDYISPSYTDFHGEDETFAKLVTEYSDDLSEFYSRFVSDCDAAKDLRGIVKDQPPNFFDVSCLPWVRYRHFDVHVFDEGKFLAPVVTWGKYETKNGVTTMPLTMNIHHAVADGFHLSRFFNEVQELINALE